MGVLRTFLTACGLSAFSLSAACILALSASVADASPTTPPHKPAARHAVATGHSAHTVKTATATRNSTGKATVRKTGKKATTAAHQRVAMNGTGGRTHRGRLWCVPYARTVSGIQIHGDARTWWAKADGYDKGHTPSIGAVMNFRPTQGMPLGHVAVVSRVVSKREILVDHANWHRNQISRGMAVIDVSENNDWSQVRVASQPNSFGRIYPVFGFISSGRSGG